MDLVCKHKYQFYVIHYLLLNAYNAAQAYGANVIRFAIKEFLRLENIDFILKINGRFIFTS